ncbi:ferrochelatase [Nakamurella sp. YIM 132087]|uniref:Coproporphyrin III ferrochelatase n=1 Tax=Nakamurella alba TaxID=2665158 RepID=A0A7K1FGB3_9ACTN|nr:ferrochelatase [Nakamurella alba]MTD13151.1 ferrochelatase [Nakamurella alba]
MTAGGYDAVLLAGFGGPEGPDDVMPFLRNVTRGRGIPEERLVEVSHHYQALGGVSPINDQNRALRAALEKALRHRGLDLPVIWGNRNWEPYISDVVADAARDGRRRLLGVATSAYSSYSSCRQYREDFGGALLSTGLVGEVVIDKIRPYFDTAGFIDPFADGTAAAVQHALDDDFDISQIEILFTTHSIPDAMADSSGAACLGDHVPGGAYVTQHMAACAAVAAAVAGRCGATPAWQLVYQSRSGPPSMPWLEPDICDVIEGMGARGYSAAVVVPIGFVSDHVEVVWDLDHEARDAAEAAGVWFERVATPGTDRRFVAGLAALVAERLQGRRPDLTIGPVSLPQRPDFCATGCCVNLRGAKPTTAGQDSARDWEDTDVSAEQLIRSGIPGRLPV